MSDKFKNNPALRTAVYDNHKRWLEDHAQEVAEHDRKFGSVLKSIQEVTGMPLHFLEIDNFKGNHAVGKILAVALVDPSYPDREKLEIATKLAIVDPKPYKQLLIGTVQELRTLQPSISLDIIMQNIERYASATDAHSLRKLLESSIQSPFLLKAFLKTQEGANGKVVDVIAEALNSEVMVEEAISQIAKLDLKDHPQIKNKIAALSEDDPLHIGSKFVVHGDNKRYTGKEQLGRIQKAIRKL
jgi:hypothetical protein